MASSSASRRLNKPPSSFVIRHESTMWNSDKRVATENFWRMQTLEILALCAMATYQEVNDWLQNSTHVDFLEVLVLNVCERIQEVLFHVVFHWVLDLGQLTVGLAGFNQCLAFTRQHTVLCTAQSQDQTCVKVRNHKWFDLSTIFPNTCYVQPKHVCTV